MTGEMPRTLRAEMLARIWTEHMWPEHGDVKALTLAMRDDEEVGAGITVFGPQDLTDLADALLEALLGEERLAPKWMAFTATVFFDTVDREQLAQITGHLEDNPLPTTRHGLIVLLVDRDGFYSVCWQVDLDPEIALPEEPAWASSAHPNGGSAVLMHGLFNALVMIGEET